MKILYYSSNFPEVYESHYQYYIIGSRNGFDWSIDNPFPDPMVILIYDAIWHP